MAVRSIVIAGDLAARASVAIAWTRGIRSTDLDMRAVVLQVITVETVLADKAIAVPAAALGTDIGDRVLVAEGSCAGAGTR